MTEREITEPVSLCRAEGGLDPAACGWTRRPLHRCNLSGHWPRKKKWNCWTIFNQRFAFSAAIADLDYASAAVVYLADLGRGRVIERRGLQPLRARAPRMAEHVEASAGLRNETVSVTMAAEGGQTSLLVAWEDFHEGDRLSAAFLVSHPGDHESLGVVVPWDRRRFTYASRHNGLPAQGRLRLGYREIAFDHASTLAVFDFERGMRPARATWNHGAACGRIVERDRSAEAPEHLMGLNLGGRWTDGTGATENALWMDGRIRKISEDLHWEYDASDLRKPWHVHTADSRTVDLSFTPEFERAAHVAALRLHYGVRQMFGRYGGRLRLAGGQTVEVDELFGWASEYSALW